MVELQHLCLVLYPSTDFFLYPTHVDVHQLSEGYYLQLVDIDRPSKHMIFQ